MLYAYTPAPSPIRRRRARRGLAYLGAETDPTQQVLTQLCPSGVGKSPCTTSSASTYTAFLTQAIQSRMLPAPTQQTASTNCSGVAVSTSAITGLKIGSAATGIATGVTSALTAGAAAGTTGAAIGSVVPIVGTAVGAILGVIMGIFAHHAAAEQLQTNILCSIVPQTNAVLQQIDQGLAAGTLSPSDAATTYSQLLSQFQSAVQSDPSFKTGDALDGYNKAMAAVIAARNYDLNNGYLTGGAPGPWTLSATGQAANTISSAASAISSATGIPSSTLAWAALGVLAVWLFK